jgi:two-component system, OmpR family, KDP operon response regulator KdpE
MTAVLIADDDATFVRVLAAELVFEGFDVLHADTSAALLNAIPRADLVVLGTRSSAGSQVTGVIREVRGRGWAQPIIVFTESWAERMRIEAFAAGADDCVAKPIAVRELVARIFARLRPRRAASQRERGRCLVRGDIMVDLTARKVSRSGRAVHLTPKEFCLLVALMEAGDVVSLKGELLSAVWGLPAGVRTRTLDFHIASLRAKLALRPPETHIETIPKVGYRIVC